MSGTFTFRPLKAAFEQTVIQCCCLAELSLTLNKIEHFSKVSSVLGLEQNETFFKGHSSYNAILEGISWKN